MNSERKPPSAGRVDALSEGVVAEILKTLRGLRYGVVSIVVQRAGCRFVR
jgi:hypothetical protein